MFEIRPATIADVPLILELIRDLATYERAPDGVTTTEEQLADVCLSSLRRSRAIAAAKRRRN